MISIRQMRSVVAVLEEGSFTRAAERENATQSGISQHVSAVEQQLGASLFERTSDGVKPTKAGERLLSPLRRNAAHHGTRLCRGAGSVG